MMYATEKEAILQVLEQVENPSPLLRSAIKAFREEMAMAGPRDDRPFHLGFCRCKPGECRK